MVPLPIGIWPFVGTAVAPVPPELGGKVPVTPVDKGRPVALVRVRNVGTPRLGVTSVGLVENTRLVLVVPVAPAAEYPVILLKAVMPAELAFVPPLATGNTPVTPAVRLTCDQEAVPDPLVVKT